MTALLKNFKNFCMGSSPVKLSEREPFQTAVIVKNDHESFEIHFPYAGQYISEHPNEPFLFSKKGQEEPKLYDIRADAEPKSILDHLQIAKPHLGQVSEETKSIFEQHDKVDRLVEKEFTHENNFLNAVITAYNDHLGLELSPDVLWNAFCQCVGRHINEYAEYYRTLFVDHQGRKALEVELFAENWPLFLDLMAQKVREELKCDLDFDPKFSTTTTVSLLTANATKMYSFKAYFHFRMMLCCGYSGLRLTGNDEDWKRLMEKVDEMLEVLMQFCQHHPFTDKKHKHWSKFDPAPNQHPALHDLTRWRPNIMAALSNFYQARICKKWTKELDTWLSQSVVEISYGSGGDSSSSIIGWIGAFLCYDRNGAFSQKPSTYDVAPSVVEFPCKVCYDGNTEIERKVSAGFLKTVVTTDGYVQPTLGVRVLAE